MAGPPKYKNSRLRLNRRRELQHFREFLRALDFDVDATRKIESHQSVDRLVGRLKDVDETIVGSKLEVLHRLLVDVRSSDNAEASKVRRKRNWTRNSGAGALCRLRDLLGRLVDDPVIVCAKSNANFNACHVCNSAREFPASGMTPPPLKRLSIIPFRDGTPRVNGNW